MKKLFLFFFIQFIMISSLYSQGVIKAGDTAPELSVDEWIKGDPVNDFEKGTVYLVEFWGTWCTPCINNIPHLSELQNKYSSDGLIVIGVATHEFKGRDVLIDFMNGKKGSEMEYRVAYDTDLSMQADWDTGSKEGDNFRLPVCFLIDKNRKVVFAGHPEEEKLEGLIEKTLSEK